MGKKKFQLHCDHTGEMIFEGWFETIKQTVEQAVIDHVCLDGVDLSGVNLACANLDDAQLSGANLSSANLNGANLSESIFDNANLSGADVSHACFALSSCMNVNMIGTSFGNTDVTDAVISGCQFSCPSVFTMSFGRAAMFANCTYIGMDGMPCRMTKPPVVITGLSREVVYMDDVIKIGNDFVSKIDMIAAGDRHLEFLYGREIAAFIRPVLYENIVNL